MTRKHRDFVVHLGMNSQLKTRFVGLSVILCGTYLLAGCASSHPSMAWQGRGPIQDNGGSSSALVYLPNHQDTTVFASTMSYTDAPEYSRRDFTLSTRDVSRRDELFGIRPEVHPSLNNQRRFRTSRNADEYVYPSTKSRGYRRGYSYRRYSRD